MKRIREGGRGLRSITGTCPPFFEFQSILHLFNATFVNYISEFQNVCVFMPPRSKIVGHIVLNSILSVILSFCKSVWNFYLANHFWTVIARALIFYLSIPSGKTFPRVPTILTLWSWSWEFDLLFENFCLLKTFE